MGEGLRVPVGVRVVLVVGVWVGGVAAVAAETELVWGAASGSVESGDEADELVWEGVRGALESGEGVSEAEVVSTPGCSQRLERPALSIA